uniref:Keratin-associated protein 20-2-like n=1 Tax=Cavia porcellus TaxID=10141 RepID=A0A286XIT7_CAVPO
MCYYGSFYGGLGCGCGYGGYGYSGYGCSYCHPLCCRRYWSYGFY